MDKGCIIRSRKKQGFKRSITIYRHHRTHNKLSLFLSIEIETWNNTTWCTNNMVMTVHLLHGWILVQI